MEDGELNKVNQSSFEFVWWRDLKKVYGSGLYHNWFDKNIKCELGNGRKTIFWKDR